jgi:hypothetical protein
MQVSCCPTIGEPGFVPIVESQLPDMVMISTEVQNTLTLGVCST